MSQTPEALFAGSPLPPSPLAREQIAGLSGKEILEGLLSGALPAPPFGPTTNIAPAEIGEGRVVFIGRAGAGFLNPMGIIHGGWIATILDTAMGCAVHSTLKAGQTYTTTSMTVNYVRPLTENSAIVRCEAVAVYTGARTATSEGKLFDERGRLVAHGSETCMIMSPSKE